MRKKVTGLFRELIQSKNTQYGPVLMYNGDPEGEVKGYPGALCMNLNYGTDGILYYQKVLGWDEHGWSPVYGGSPRSVVNRVESLSADGDKIIFTAPENLVVRKVLISFDTSITTADGANNWGLNLKNYGSLATHTAFGGEMLASDKMINTETGRYVEVEVVPDQNRFMRAGTVMEMLFDETGAPTSLSNVNITVFYWPGCGRTETISANIGTVSSTNEDVTEGFLCKVPKNGYVEKITVTASTSAASDANDKYDIQVTNLYHDGSGSLELCSTAHDTNTNTDVYGYNDATNLVNTPCDLVIDQNRFVMENDVLRIDFTATKDADLTDLEDCVVTVHLTLFDSEEVKAVQGTTSGNLGNTVVLDGTYERFILWTAPYACKLRGVYVLSDTGKLLDPTDFLQADVWKFAKRAHGGTDRHPVRTNSVTLTTQTGEAGAEPITADALWPDPTGDLTLVDQNMNLEKGDVVKIEFYSEDLGGGGTAGVIGTEYCAFILEIEGYDPDQVGLSRTDLAWAMNRSS